MMFDVVGWVSVICCWIGDYVRVPSTSNFEVGRTYAVWLKGYGNDDPDMVFDIESFFCIMEYQRIEFVERHGMKHYSFDWDDVDVVVCSVKYD